ncbi:MAG: hypothetical protein V1706_15205 [Pseudomonadota bacterium]
MNSISLHYDLKKSLARKAWMAGAIILVAAVVAGVVHRYFYYLDAYLYTYEFYWLFNTKNLQAADTALFIEYFTPMGITTEALPQILLSHLIQNFYLPFSKPILVTAAASAFGLTLGVFFSYIALLLTGFLGFLAGSFFLGDLLPLLCGKEFSHFREKIIRSPWVAVIISLLFAIPWLPVSFTTFAGAFLKFPLPAISRFMLAGLLLRVVLLLAAPALFH